MSIQGLPFPNTNGFPTVSGQTVPGLPAPATIGIPVSATAPTQTDGIMFDWFQRLQCKPVLTETPKDQAAALLLHPQQYRWFQKIGAPEGPVQSVQMTNKIMHNLDPATQQQFQNLLKQGILTRGKSDDGHSALYHLYGILTTRRAPGYDNRAILRETIQVLGQPYSISQRFAPLEPDASRRIMQVRNNPGLNRNNTPSPVKPLEWQDLNVENSATCVASSVMYYMADKEPTALARQINELTSPMNAFFEKARFDEISPDDPQQALRILQEHQIPYYVSGPGEVTVKVDNPPAGVVRAVDSQKVSSSGQFRNAIGAAYQSAITHLATRSYDPASDMRDSDTPNETSKGLTEAEKTLMEAIIKDNGGVQSVTYQAVGGKANPAPGEESNSYLYGYNRSFEQTTNDILQALQMNEPVIIGTTDTDASGAVIAGHEITITGSYIDPKDQERKFVVADSDDSVPTPVVKSARELIPTIHHAGLPVRLARQINQQIQGNQGYLIPDAQDQAHFKLLARETGPMPVENDASTTPAQPINPTAAIQPPANATSSITWLPVNPIYPQTNPFAQAQPIKTWPSSPAPITPAPIAASA